MKSNTFLQDIGNGQRETRTIIGTITVDEFVHRTTEQTACNWREITVPAGTYDVVLDGRGYWALIAFPGIKTDEYFVNRLFTASSVAEKRGIGEPATAFWQIYNYEAAKRFATDPNWVLADDWSVEMTQRHYEHNGAPYKSFALVGPKS
jgi:hypothetical protein